MSGQFGLEETPEEYVAKMVEIFREVRRVLRKDGTLWLNLGDSYNGSSVVESSRVNQDSARKAILIELNPKYVELIKHRCNVTPGLALA